MATKEFVTAIDQRIKAPYFGYALLAFFVINWKELFFLFAAKKSAAERILYFSNGTDVYDILLYPLLSGILFAAAAPWTHLFFQFISVLPVMLSNNITQDAEHKALTRQADLEFERNRLLETQEKEVIDRAKRDDEAAKIQDDDKRSRVQEELQSLRSERDGESLKQESKEEADLLRSQIENLRQQAHLASKQNNFDMEKEYLNKIEFLQEHLGAIIKSSNRKK